MVKSIFILVNVQERTQTCLINTFKTV